MADRLHPQAARLAAIVKANLSPLAHKYEWVEATAGIEIHRHVREGCKGCEADAALAALVAECDAQRERIQELEAGDSRLSAAVVVEAGNWSPEAALAFVDAHPGDADADAIICSLAVGYRRTFELYEYAETQVGILTDALKNATAFKTLDDLNAARAILGEKPLEDGGNFFFASAPTTSPVPLDGAYPISGNLPEIARLRVECDAANARAEAAEQNLEVAVAQEAAMTTAFFAAEARVAQLEQALADERVRAGVAFSFIPAARVDAYHERIELLGAALRVGHPQETPNGS